MASVKNLKKEVNNMVFDVVEECFSIQLYNPSKKEATDEFINEAADYLSEILRRINAAEKKADYNAIVNEAEAKADEWLERLNKMN